MRRVRSIVAAVPAVIGAVAAFLSAAGWLILQEPEAAHAGLLVGIALVAFGGLAAGRTHGALEDTPELEARHVARVRIAGLLTRLLSLASFIILALAAAVIVSRPDVVPEHSLDRASRLLTAALTAAAAALVATTLVTRRASRGGWLAGSVGLALALALTAGAGLVHIYGDAYPQYVPDVPSGMFALLASVVLGLAVPLARGVPSLGELIQPPRGATLRRTTGAGRAFVPAAVAFGLVIVIFLTILLFGVGVEPVVREVGSSPALAAAVAFVLLMLVGAVVGVFIASKRTPSVALYKEKVDPRKRFEQGLLAASMVLSLFFVVPAALTIMGYDLGLPARSWRHLLCVGVMIALGPYGFYIAREQKRIRTLEERFPDFLRDVASSHKGGLTLPAAILVASRGEYGPLTGEVNKMADQLKWNVPFTEALRLFSERVRTPLVQRAVNLILEANRTGGSTTGLLLAAARDAREIKSLENERRLSMSLYTVVIYVTFFVFLGVAATLYSQFIPQLVATGQAAAEVDPSQQVEGVSSGGLSLRAFEKFYFLAAVFQGVGDGVVAGIMGSGRALLGLQHAFWMVLFAYGTFVFLL